KIHALYPPWSSPLAKLILAALLLFCGGLYFYRHQQQQTSLVLAHNKSQASKAQMQLALQSSNSGIWDYYIADDLLYEDRVMSELGYQKFELPISSKLHISLIHPDDHKALKSQWRDFFGGKTDDIDVSYRMRSKTGQWHWYRDVGRVISRDQFDQPTRVSGTYTNITAIKANEMRAQLFGEAFSQINDWVLILDANREPVTANAAFLRAFSFGASKNIPQFDDFVNALGKKKYQEFKEIIDNIPPGESWHGEEVIVSAEKEHHPVLVSINAIANHSETISNYVIVVSDITNQKDAEEKLRHLAHYDFLTNLPNRKLILERIEYAIAKFADNHKKFALFFIDLDKFKQINDSLGHSVGDDLLRHVADTIVSNIKVSDLVARQSGDEFMILIEGFETIDDLSHLAQRLNKCLAQPINLQGSLVNITSSIGIAIYPDDAASSADLIRTADLAMIHAKDAGRSQFQFFTQDMNEKVQQRLLLERELRQAFIDNALVNFYQPIVHSGLQKIIGFELLLRWPQVDGMIPPEVFIPIAEDIGLISKITEVAVDQALADYAKLQRQGADIYISVNLSPIHILQQGLCQTLTNLLVKHQLPPEVLRLEITEGILFTDQVKALARLKELKAHGFKLLLDDFGTGYSSLTYLSQFPIDVLKIDQSFVRNIDTNPMTKPIIKSIVSLADNLGLSCIAEGVETYEQLSYIRSLGCENIQGYFYAKPASVNEIANLTLDDQFGGEFNPIP
ncbi:MAG: EAL domain-containing protein, partial [Gammaproteobacteria bacterium]|nr:EAL domain-containing protein [Gammaproteobacteria bacterium]